LQENPRFGLQPKENRSRWSQFFRNKIKHQF